MSGRWYGDGRPEFWSDWAAIFAGTPRTFTATEKDAAGYLRTCPVGLIFPALRKHVGELDAMSVSSFWDFDDFGRASVLFLEAVVNDDFEAAEELFEIFNSIRKCLINVQSYNPKISRELSTRLRSAYVQRKRRS